MADKSLSTIARELWQGFGRNPRNTETFEALANVNPIMAAYRGAKTLSNVDLNALKQAYLNEAYGRNDPAVNREAGRQLGNIAMGSLDVLPVVPVAKAGLKAAAPTIARQAVNLADKYGVSPVMTIVPPEGNLRLSSRLDEQIRGHETQPAQYFIQQAVKRPGVTREGLKDAGLLERFPDTAQKISKQEFIEAIPPSKYNVVDLAQETADHYEHYLDEARDAITPEDVIDNLGVPYDIQDEMLEYFHGAHGWTDEIGYHDLSSEAQDWISKNVVPNAGELDDRDLFDVMIDRFSEAQQHATENHADMLMQEAGNARQHFAGTQRLLKDENVPHDYFALGISHPDQPKTYRHFEIGSDEGLVGHTRGSYHASDPVELLGGVKTKPNSYVLEEIQSDVALDEGMTGPRYQVYGTIVKAAVEDAAKRGASHVYIPTSKAVQLAPDRSMSSQKAILVYDRFVKKQGINSLKSIPGVKIKPIQGDSVGKVPMYYEIELPQEAKDYILTGPGQQTPGYAAGGLVDYNEDDVDKMSDELLQGEYGLRVTGEPKGKGALGEVRMPDGQTVMTEYSINPQGSGEMPSIVEGMHPADLNYLREYAHKALKGEDADEFPAGVEAVAKRSAQRRKAEGKPAFYGEGGAVKDPFADLGIMDKAKLLGKAIKYRVQYNKQAEEHGKYPDVLAAALKEKYREQVGNSRVNRSPLDAAINYGGGYDFGVRGDIPPAVARDMAKAYQYTDYFFSPFTGPKSDAIGDYYENMAGVEAGIKERGRRASEADIQRRAAAYGRKVSEMLPQNEEENYATGGLVYNDDEISKLANQLIGV